MRFIRSILLIHSLIFGVNSMAIEKECESFFIAEKLKKQYAENNIDTSKYPKLNLNSIIEIQKNGSQICVIHDRINDLVHSYSITLYKSATDKNLYLIYEGGFSGFDVFGFGPINLE